MYFLIGLIQMVVCRLWVAFSDSISEITQSKKQTVRSNPKSLAVLRPKKEERTAKITGWRLRDSAKEGDKFVNHPSLRCIHVQFIIAKC